MAHITDRPSLERYLIAALSSAFCEYPGTITLATSLVEIDRRTDSETVPIDWVISIEEDLDVDIADELLAMIGKQTVGDLVATLAFKLELPSLTLARGEETQPQEQN